MNQYGHVRLDARRPLQFCAFAGIDFLDEFERHISFARQTFYLSIRVGRTIDRLITRCRSYIFHDPILARCLFRGSFAYQTCHFGAKVGQNAMHPPRSVTPSTWRPSIATILVSILILRTPSCRVPVKKWPWG
jgi:hypothetical protein